MRANNINTYFLNYFPLLANSPKAKIANEEDRRKEVAQEEEEAVAGQDAVAAAEEEDFFHEEEGKQAGVSHSCEAHTLHSSLRRGKERRALTNNHSQIPLQTSHPLHRLKVPIPLETN